MHVTTDIAFSTTEVRAATWQERKQDYALMMAAIPGGDFRGARQAYERLTAGRTICPISPLAALGKALRGGDAEVVNKAAQTLHQVRTGQCYRQRSRATATKAGGGIIARRRARRASAGSFEQMVSAH